MRWERPAESSSQKRANTVISVVHFRCFGNLQLAAFLPDWMSGQEYGVRRTLSAEASTEPTPLRSPPCCLLSSPLTSQVSQRASILSCTSPILIPSR